MSNRGAPRGRGGGFGGGRGAGGFASRGDISSVTFLREADDKQVEGDSSHHMDLQQQC